MRSKQRTHAWPVSRRCLLAFLAPPPVHTVYDPSPRPPRKPSCRAKLAEQQAALDKLSDKALKRRAAEEKAAVQKLLSGLAKLLAGMQLPHATGQGAPEPPAAAYMERLAHLAGLMHVSPCACLCPSAPVHAFLGQARLAFNNGNPFLFAVLCLYVCV